jgi:tripeptidyl-peptidase-1
MLLIPTIVALLCTAAQAAAERSAERVVVESLSGVPRHWVSAGDAPRPPPSSRLYLRIALPKADQGLFEQTALQIATPGHRRYGQHLRREQVKELLKPRAASTAGVLAWLSDAGIPTSDVDEQGEWINFWASVACAEKLLDTRFNTYQNIESGERIIRALNYSVPSTVAPHLTMIQPSTRFGQIKAKRAISHMTPSAQLGKLAGGNSSSNAFNYTAACGTSGYIRPACLRALYNVGNHTGNATSSARLGVTGFLNQMAKYVDLDLFLQKFAPYAVGANFTAISINNGTLTQDEYPLDSSEANLDIQYSMALAYPANITFYSTGGLGYLVPDLDSPTQASNQNEPYLDFLVSILAAADEALPQTLTTSYGEDEQSVPEPYARTVCDMFGALGARGVSVIFSSGDEGVGGNCERNDGSNATHFNPIFPATCPWVTSVGATEGYPERAASYSSGGFSDYWPRPVWQDAAVLGYLDGVGSQWAGLYNNEGRGFPDVAAVGSTFEIFSWGFEVPLYGTRCAPPSMFPS